MSDIDNRNASKDSIRQLLATHGAAGTLSLLGEVLAESVPNRKGRPTRDEAVNRAIVQNLGGLIPKVITLEGKALNAKVKVEQA